MAARKPKADLSKYEGRFGFLDVRTLPGIRIGVRVSEAKMKFGRVDLRISPVSGGGSTWVRATSVELLP